MCVCVNVVMHTHRYMHIIFSCTTMKRPSSLNPSHLLQLNTIKHTKTHFFSSTSNSSQNSEFYITQIKPNHRQCFQFIHQNIHILIVTQIQNHPINHLNNKKLIQRPHYNIKLTNSSYTNNSLYKSSRIFHEKHKESIIKKKVQSPENCQQNWRFQDQKENQPNQQLTWISTAGEDLHWIWIPRTLQKSSRVSKTRWENWSLERENGREKFWKNENWRKSGVNVEESVIARTFLLLPGASKACD